MEFFPDISSYQAGIDVAKLPGPILIARCWRGNVDAPDPEWPRFRDAARRAGKLPVAYIYVGERSRAAHQAQRLVDHMGDRSIPVMLDWERTGGSIRHLRAVHAEIERRGVRCRLSYIPRWWWEQQLSPDLAGLPPLINSHYYGADRPDGWVPFGGRFPVIGLQYTDREVHAGRSIDMNAYRGTREQLMALLGSGSTARRTLRKGDTGDDVRELQR